MIDMMVRSEIEGIEDYDVDSVSCSIKMDANENGWGLPGEVVETVLQDINSFSFHRYPDPDCRILRERLSMYTGVDPENLLVGNGSDELIQYIINTFVGSGDKVVIHTPTFSMYRFYTKLAGGEVVEVPDRVDFAVDCEGIIQCASAYGAKLIFLCNPNNPTGRAIELDGIKEILEKSRAVVVVDEAYYEFHGETVINWVCEYPNLIVLRTLSKAMALAGMRVGYLAAGNKIMRYLNKIKPPYNVNAFSQLVACRVLERSNAVLDWLRIFEGIRNQFVNDLGNIEGVQVYPTRANFVLFRVADAQRVWHRLVDKDILVRRFRDSRLEDCLRVTIGPPDENSIFIGMLSNCIREG